MADNPQGTTPKEEQLFFGKYKSVEEAEKGFSNLVGELNRFKQSTTELQVRLDATQKLQSEYEKLLARQEPTAKPASFVDEDGHLDAEALLRAIDSRLTSVDKKFEKVPELVAGTVQQLLQPLAGAGAAKEQRFARGD